MAFRKMVSMARSPEEMREKMEQMASAPMPDAPTFPYGLCITLCDDELEKLGIDKDDMPEIGDSIHLFAMAKVTSVNQSANESGDQRRIELQITDLGCENEDDENDEEERAERRYGKKEDDE